MLKILRRWLQTLLRSRAARQQRLLPRKVSVHSPARPRARHVDRQAEPHTLFTAPEQSKQSKRKYEDSSDEDELEPPTSAKKPRKDSTPQPDESVPPTPALEIPEPALERAVSEPAVQDIQPDSPAEVTEVPASAAAAPTDVKVTTTAEEGSPAAAPDTPKADATAEPGFVAPALSETGPNVFLTWVDGIRTQIDLEDASDSPVYWLKSQIISAYGSPTGEEEELDATVGYWVMEIDEEAFQPAPAAELRAAWQDTSAKADHWVEVTVVRQEPEDDTTPRLKVSLESSAHDDQHDTHDGKKLGEWWITGIAPASPEAAAAMQM